MKSIKSLVKWILFVPVCLMSVVVTVINGLHSDSVSDFFTTDQNGIAEIITYAVLGLFIVCFVLSLFDRKTSPVHLLHKNFFCGVTALLSAFALAATAALDITHMVTIGEIEAMAVLTSVFTAISGVAMLFIGLNHFSGTNNSKKISLFYLSLPLWCGVHLIDRFLKHTAMPVAAADTMDLVMFVAMALFFIYAMMIHALIPGKNAVKSAINFGFPTVIVSLVYGVSLGFSVLNAEPVNYLDLIPAVTYGLIGLYALGFTAELSFKSKTTEEQRVLAASEENSDEQYEEYNHEYEEGIAENVPAGDFTDEEYTAVATDEEAEDNLDTYNASDPSFEEEDTDTEDYYEDTESQEEEDVPAPVVAAAVRVVVDDEEEYIDESINTSEDTTVEEDSAEEDNVAQELFMAAQQRDLQSADIDNTPDTISTIGSDDTMIIEGETAKVTPAFGGTNNSDIRPKGPTTREAIMYEDDDFILTMDGTESDAAPVFDESEDISAFILESQESAADLVSKKKNYEDRLDEIDQLIISIQGGDPSDTEEF